VLAGLIAGFILSRLFLEARRDRHGGGISTNEELIRDLLRAIRLKVNAAELDQPPAAPMAVQGN
jgi:hypothetical protein